MQLGRRIPVAGIVYNTTLRRPDAALALAMLYGLEGKREARVASIAVTENSLGAAAFADAVFRFYQLGPVPNANRALPVGLAADKPLPPDSAPVNAVFQRVDGKGEPLYQRRMRRVSDTAEVTALMRNSLAYIEDGLVTVILSAPATYLARILDYAGAAELIQAKVRTAIVCEGPQDPEAMRKVLSSWPTPLQFCGRDVGQALPYPAESIEKDFAWTQAHPVVDFYRAAAPMPYDAPALDLAAILHAVRPDSGLFQQTSGAIEVSDGGLLSFTPSAEGKHRRLVVDPGKKDQIVAAMRELVAAKPVPPPQRRRLTAEEIEQFRKQREEEQLKRAEAERKAAAAAKP